MPERVRVTRTRSAGTKRVHRPVARDLAEQTGLGEVYLRGLMRAQLRLSLTILLTGGALLGGLPLLFAVIPATRRVAVLGLPLPWLLLGVLVYPAAVVTARFYVRGSERIERQFTRLAVGPDDDPAPGR